METLTLVSLLVGGFSALWWRLGRVEGKMNSTVQKWHEAEQVWAQLQQACPLCPKGRKTP